MPKRAKPRQAGRARHAATPKSRSAASRRLRLILVDFLVALAVGAVLLWCKDRIARHPLGQFVLQANYEGEEPGYRGLHHSLPAMAPAVGADRLSD